jgi:hypothetical protein
MDLTIPTAAKLSTLLTQTVFSHIMKITRGVEMARETVKRWIPILILLAIIPIDNDFITFKVA